MLTKSGLNVVAASAPPGGTATLASARYDNDLGLTAPGGDGKPLHHDTSKATLPRGSSPATGSTSAAS